MTLILAALVLGQSLGIALAQTPARAPAPTNAETSGANSLISYPSIFHPVKAENGVVVYAGSSIPGFGRMLLVRHAESEANSGATIPCPRNTVSASNPSSSR